MTDDQHCNPGSGEPGFDRLLLTPMNILEKRLVEYLGQETPIEGFLEELFRSPVFVVFHGKPTPQGPPSPLQPLIFESPQGFPVLCVFTDPCRFHPFQTHCPEFETGLLVAFTWVLQSTPEGVGVIIDPGWDASLEQSPEEIARYRVAVKS